MAHPQTDAEQVRAFFTRMAEGLSIKTSSDLLHNVNSSRAARPIEQPRETLRFETMCGRDFGVGLPPLASCYEV
jgi:hypothetical protein